MLVTFDALCWDARAAGTSGKEVFKHHFHFFTAPVPYSCLFSLSDSSHSNVKFSACHRQHGCDHWSLQKCPLWFRPRPLLPFRPRPLHKPEPISALSVLISQSRHLSLELLSWHPYIPQWNSDNWAWTRQWDNSRKPQMWHKKQRTTTKVQIPATECDFKQVAKCWALFSRFLLWSLQRSICHSLVCSRGNPLLS